MSLLLLTLALLGLGGGFLSGLVGLGGAVFMIPLLLYVPALLSVGTLSEKQVAAISIVQVVSATLSGVIHHWHHRFVSRALVAYMGSGIVIGAFGGAFLSEYLSNRLLLAIFATMATIATAMIFLPHKEEADENIPAEQVRFNRPAAAVTGLSVGFIAGMVGAGGGIILIPIMVHLFNIPTRVAIGSNLGIVFLAAVSGMLGKEITGQIDWPHAVALVAGAVPGAQLGSHVSCQVKTRSLRVLIHLIIAAAGLRMWYQVITGT
jgi:uncharacterized membrane protein YfcA